MTSREEENGTAFGIGILIGLFIANMCSGLLWWRWRDVRRDSACAEHGGQQAHGSPVVVCVDGTRFHWVEGYFGRLPCR